MNPAFAKPASQSSFVCVVGMTQFAICVALRYLVSEQSGQKSPGIIDVPSGERYLLTAMGRHLKNDNLGHADLKAVVRRLTQKSVGLSIRQIEVVMKN